MTTEAPLHPTLARILQPFTGAYFSGGYWKVRQDGQVHNVARLIYEETHGSIPADHFVTYADRNPNNLLGDNLLALPRGAIKVRGTRKRTLPKGVYARTMKDGAVTYYGKLTLGGVTHRPPKGTASTLEAITAWAEGKHREELERTYSGVEGGE